MQLLTFGNMLTPYLGTADKCKELVVKADGAREKLKDKLAEERSESDAIQKRCVCVCVCVCVSVCV